MNPNSANQQNVSDRVTMEQRISFEITADPNF